MINLLSDVSDFEGFCWRHPARDRIHLGCGDAHIVRAFPEHGRTILRHLIDAGGWCSEAELTNAVWGHREDGGPEDSLNAVLYRLRGHLKDGFHIENRYGHGWRLVVDWELFEDAAIRGVREALAS